MTSNGSLVDDSSGNHRIYDRMVEKSSNYGMVGDSREDKMVYISREGMVNDTREDNMVNKSQEDNMVDNSINYSLVEAAEKTTWWMAAKESTL